MTPSLGEPPLFPSITLPEPLQLPAPILEVPRADIPYYKPLVVPPSDLRPPPGIKWEPQDEPPKETQNETKPITTIEPTKVEIPILPPQPSLIKKINIPGTDISIPIPQNEILITAGTTAVVSVATTLTATALFKRLVQIMKPVFKKTWEKITKTKGGMDSSDSSYLSGQQDSLLPPTQDG